MTVNYRTTDVNGIKIFYREAGRPSAPTLLLLDVYKRQTQEVDCRRDRLGRYRPEGLEPAPSHPPGGVGACRSESCPQRL